MVYERLPDQQLQGFDEEMVTDCFINNQILTVFSIIVLSFLNFQLIISKRDCINII